MWKNMLFGEICQITNGNSIPVKIKEKKFSHQNGMPYIATKDISFNGKVNYENGISISNDELKNFKIATQDSILICAEGGSAGRKIAYLNQNCCFVNKLFSIKASSQILPRFVFYYLKSEEFQSQFKKALTGLIGGVSLSKIKNFQITFPEELNSQTKIIEKLDNSFVEINKLNDLNKKALLQKQNLEENFFKDFFKSLEEEYGMMKLEEGIQLISGQHIMSKDYNSLGDGIGYLTGPADFGSVSPVVSKFTLKPKKTAMKNDILITLKGSGIGKVNLMDQDELAISRQLAAIRPIKFDPSYLFIFLKTKFNYFQKLGNGAAIPGLSRGDVQTLEVPKVPILKQHEVLEKLQKFQLLLSRYETCQNLKFKELKSLKSSILLKELQSDIL